MITGTFIDFGNPLGQEISWLTKSKLNKENDTAPEEPEAEHQFGENIVFEIFKRYTGNVFDEDDDLMDTIFSVPGK